MDCGRKWLVDFSAEKSQLNLFNWSYNTVAIDVKMSGSVIQEKLSFKMLRLISSSKLDWCSYIISIANTSSKKMEPWFVLWSFFVLRLLRFMRTFMFHIKMLKQIHVLTLFIWIFFDREDITDFHIIYEKIPTKDTKSKDQSVH